MKRKILIFLAGCVCGAALLGFFLSLREIGKGFSRWGNVVACSDKEVRESIAGARITLPEGCHDLHYAINGFMGHTVWIKFSVPRDKLWKAVQDNIFREKENLPEEIPETLGEPIPQNHDEQVDLSWWNPHQVAHPRSWSHEEQQKSSHSFQQWMVDEEKSLIYVIMGSY